MYLFKPNASSTEFLGASEQLYKCILFYLNEDLPNISPPLFQGNCFANIFPHPITALYGIWHGLNLAQESHNGFKI